MSQRLTAITLLVPPETPVARVQPLLDLARALGIAVTTNAHGRLIMRPADSNPAPLAVHPTVARIRAARVDLRGDGR